MCFIVVLWATSGAHFTKIDLGLTEHGQLITCPVKYGMQLFIIAKFQRLPLELDT